MMQLSNRKACDLKKMFIYIFSLGFFVLLVCQSSTPIRSAVLHMYQPLLTNRKWPMIVGDGQIDPITCQVLLKYFSKWLPMELSRWLGEANHLSQVSNAPSHVLHLLQGEP